jgi:MYXO-CTERM domain-containing protein
MAGTLLASSERFTLTAVGQPCTLAAECGTGVCTSGTCAPPTIAPDASIGPLPDATFAPEASPDSVLEATTEPLPDADNAGRDTASTSFYGCALGGKPAPRPIAAAILAFVLVFAVRLRRRRGRSCKVTATTERTMLQYRQRDTR